MYMINKVLLFAIIITTIINCGGKKQQIMSLPNLIINTGTLDVGSNNIVLSNRGGVAIQINSIELNNQFNDNIIILDNCSAKLLAGHNECHFTIHTDDEQKGVSKLLLYTNYGTWEKSLNVNSVHSPILTLSKKSINTTKPIELTLTNISKNKIKIQNINFEKEDYSLSIVNTNCNYRVLQYKQTCMITLQASNNTKIMHTLTVHTNNPYLHNNIPLNEDTTIANIIVGNNALNKPGDTQLVLDNTGSKDVIVNSVDIPSNIGVIKSIDCLNKTLQAGDQCTLNIMVSKNAHGIGNIILNENKNNPYTVYPSLTVKNKGISITTKGDVPLYLNAHSLTLHILNTNNFVVSLNGITVENNTIRILFTTCANELEPKQECDIVIAPDTDHSDFNEIRINQLDGNMFIIPITLKSGNLSIQIPGINDKLYQLLPDAYGKLYQIISFHNSYSNPVVVLLEKKNFINIKSGEFEPKIYGLTPCQVVDNYLDKDIIINIPKNQSCELIIYEVNSYLFYQLMMHYRKSSLTDINGSISLFNGDEIPEKNIHLKYIFNTSDIHKVKKLIDDNEVIHPHTNFIKQGICHRITHQVSYEKFYGDNLLSRILYTVTLYIDPDTNTLKEYLDLSSSMLCIQGLKVDTKIQLEDLLYEVLVKQSYYDVNTTNYYPNVSNELQCYGYTCTITVKTDAFDTILHTHSLTARISFILPVNVNSITIPVGQIINKDSNET